MDKDSKTIEGIDISEFTEEDLLNDEEIDKMIKEDKSEEIKPKEVFTLRTMFKILYNSIKSKKQEIMEMFGMLIVVYVPVKAFHLGLIYQETIINIFPFNINNNSYILLLFMYSFVVYLLTVIILEIIEKQIKIRRGTYY